MDKSFELDDELKIRLQGLADKGNRSMNCLLQEAVREYLERDMSRENFQRELQSWSKPWTTCDDVPPPGDRE